METATKTVDRPRTYTLCETELKSLGFIFRVAARSRGKQQPRRVCCQNTFSRSIITRCIARCIARLHTASLFSRVSWNPRRRWSVDRALLPSSMQRRCNVDATPSDRRNDVAWRSRTGDTSTREVKVSWPRVIVLPRFIQNFTRCCATCASRDTRHSAKTTRACSWNKIKIYVMWHSVCKSCSLNITFEDIFKFDTSNFLSGCLRRFTNFP